MIACLLLEPVLSEGNASATEAVHQRSPRNAFNRTDGSVCHKETIGDYATCLSQLELHPSTITR